MLLLLMLMLLPLMGFSPPPQDGGGGSGSILSTVIMIGSVFVIFYFMILRPQSKRQKEMKLLLDNVKKGDKVVTGSGMHGTVSDIDETRLLIQIAENTRVWFEKTAVTAVVNKENKEK